MFPQNLAGVTFDIKSNRTEHRREYSIESYIYIYSTQDCGASEQKGG